MNKFFEALVGENIENKNIFTPLLGEWEIEWVDGKGTENERHVIGEWLFSEILNGEGIQMSLSALQEQKELLIPNLMPNMVQLSGYIILKSKNGTFVMLA